MYVCECRRNKSSEMEMSVDETPTLVLVHQSLLIKLHFSIQPSQFNFRLFIVNVH